MLIECTKNLADEMKMKLSDITPLRREPFYEWHANLFVFEGRKGVILMNNRTRYSIVLYGLKAEHFRELDTIVLSAIEETFIAEGFPSDKVKRYIENCSNVVYTKTHNRSIISQMNDFYVAVSWEIKYHLPSSSINMIELSKFTGRLLCSTLGYIYPVELLKKAIEEIKITP